MRSKARVWAVISMCVSVPFVVTAIALRPAEAVTILGRHPLIGRAVEDGMRELVISRGRSGHVALYSFEPIDDARDRA